MVFWDGGINLPTNCPPFKLYVSLKGIWEFELWTDEFGLNQSKKLKLLYERVIFKQKLDGLAEKIDACKLKVSYSSAMSCLPSQACEDARCLDYNKPYLNSRSAYLMRMLQLLNVVEVRRS